MSTRISTGASSLFEDVRRRLAPEKPSRLRALFGFSTPDNLTRYLTETPGVHLGYCLEVRDDANVHTASLATFSEFNRVRDADSALRLVEQYWTGAVDDHHEILVGTPAAVIDRL